MDHCQAKVIFWCAKTRTLARRCETAEMRLGWCVARSVCRCGDFGAAYTARQRIVSYRQQKCYQFEGASDVSSCCAFTSLAKRTYARNKSEQSSLYPQFGQTSLQCRPDIVAWHSGHSVAPVGQLDARADSSLTGGTPTGGESFFVASLLLIITMTA